MIKLLKFTLSSWLQAHFALVMATLPDIQGLLRDPDRCSVTALQVSILGEEWPVLKEGLCEEAAAYLC